MSPAVIQDYWDASYKDLPLRPNEEGVLFKELMEKHVRRGGSCFEVGCYPGHYLLYLARHFGCTVSGIDATPFVEDRLPAFLESMGAKVGRLYRGDFLAFRPGAAYDFVFSNGFLEHFENFGDVIERHVDLVAPGGCLMLSAPNFRRGQYVLRRLLDPVNLRRHVLAAMDLGAWRRVLERRGMEILHEGYHRTFEFWADSPQGWIRRRLTHYARAVGTRIDARIDRPNAWFSPYMVSLSRKP